MNSYNTTLLYEMMFADELGYFRKCVLMMTTFNPFITFKWPKLNDFFKSLLW
jgi:hypothetical protein